MNRPPRLAHHLSLPKTLTDISAMEKLLFEDTVVPCRIRAKRGCATHPRSIAERVRIAVLLLHNLSHLPITLNTFSATSDK